MKIKAYQYGGIAYIPSRGGVEASAATEAAGASSASSKTPNFAKEIIDIIGRDGLDADVQAFLNSVQNTLDLANDPTGQNLSMREIVALTRQASLVKTNYADYGKARDNLDKEKAWGEYALDSRGRVYAMDKEGKITTVKVDEVMKGEYAPITNEELLDLRRRPEYGLAYNGGVLDDVYGAVGMKSITDYASDIIKNFGKTDLTGYSQKKGSEIRSGINEIIEGTLSNGNTVDSVIQQGPDGVYKISEESTVADRNINAALAYVKSTLPANYLQTLEAKAKLSGYSADAFLLNMITANTSRKITPNYEDALSKGGSGSGSGGSEAMIQHTLMENYCTGDNLPGFPKYSEITPAGSTSSIIAYNQDAGVAKTADEKHPLGVCSMAQFMESAYGVRQISTGTKVSFGDQLIDADDLGGLVYDGSNMTRIEMPYKVVEGNNIVPDFELQDKLNAIVTAEENKGSEPEIITRLLNSVCPGAQYNEETHSVKIPRSRTHAFMGISAYGSDTFINFDRNSKYLVKSDKSADVYKEAVRFGFANHAKNAEERLQGTAKHRFMSGSTGNRLYEGVVYVPIISSVAGSAMSNPEYSSKANHTSIMERGMENERRQMAADQLSNPDNLNW